MSQPAPQTSGSVNAVLERIRTRQARVGVVGLGYVGLPLVLLFSGERFAVTGFDIDVQKVTTLNNGGSYIVRIMPDEINAARSNGFRATTDFTELSAMDCILIAVPTPLDELSPARPQLIVTTAESIAPNLRAGQTRHPGEHHLSRHHRGGCWSPPGEGKSRRPAGGAQTRELRGFYVVFSPEREDPATTRWRGAIFPRSSAAAAQRRAIWRARVYGSIFNRTVPVSSPAAAEMTKLLENIYRCVNIALVNELKQLCMRMGIDIWEVIDAAKTKPFGFQAFYPGPGLGGHCIPIDPFYLSWKAKEFDFHTRFIELAGEINVAMPYFVVENVVEAMSQRGKALNGARVLVLGLAYKRDIDDLRESPSLTIIELLQKRGARVEYNDPFFPTVGHGRQLRAEHDLHAAGESGRSLIAW